jgi:hypothetical protein
MSAQQDFIALIQGTQTMQEVLRALETEPIRLLGNICQEYEKTGQPVPDHHIHPSGYVGEVSLRALVAAGMVKLKPGRRFSLYEYEPTPEGLEHYKRLTSAGVYAK